MPLGPDLQRLQDHLEAKHHDKPQNATAIRAALAEVGHGLAALARLGHTFHLETGLAPVLDDDNSWPRLMFHTKWAPNGRLVYSRWELTDLGAGWYWTLEAAQHADGVAQQFEGRAGVRDSRFLPVLR